MNYAEQQRQPTKHLVSFGVVIVLHIALGWALVNGLARKVVEVIKGPIETKIIDEIKQPPPPEEALPPPKVAPPPPSFVPPPEIQIAAPAAGPTITVTREAPPPTPVKIAPPPLAAAPPAPAPASAPKPQAVPARIDVATCEKPEFPAAATRAEATGVTKIRFTVDSTGAVSKAEIEKSAGNSREHRLLDRAAVDALSKCRFKPGTDEHGKPIGGTTLVEYVWKLE